MREVNVEEMRRQGLIIFLTAEPETIYERVKASHARPLLEGNMNTAYIETLLARRLPAYEAAADFCVPTDGRTIPEISGEIWSLLKKH